LNNPVFVFAIVVHSSRPVVEDINEYPLAPDTDATHRPCPVVEVTPYAIPVIVVPRDDALLFRPTQSTPLYEYNNEMDGFPLAFIAPATHNPRPRSSRP
jgi:hypothetical protein